MFPSVCGAGFPLTQAHFFFRLIRITPHFPSVNENFFSSAYTDSAFQPSRTQMARLLPSLVLAAASNAFAGVSPAEVEKRYWDCEFMAVYGALDLDDAAACSETYERLKSDKFQGDFARFLVWWKENKEREMTSRKRRMPLQRSQ